MSLFGRLLGRSPQPPAPQAVLPAVAQPAPVAVPENMPDIVSPAPSPMVPAAPQAVTVTIDYDVAPHIERVLALLRDLTAWNFTKAVMRRNLSRGAAELRHLLTRPMVQAGLVRVHAGGNDLGYCGIYVLRSDEGRRRLLHYCFSADIAGFGVETWLYQRLGRPDIDIKGEVAVDIRGSAPAAGSIIFDMDGQPPSGSIGTIYARGSNDLSAMLHYFEMLGYQTTCDFSTERAGMPIPLQHSVIARYAMDGLDPAALDALMPLGFRASDFHSVLTAPGLSVRAVWLLSFWSDAQMPLCQHRSTGVSVPARIPAAPEDGVEETPEQWERRRSLRQSFDQTGPIEEKPFKENLSALLGRALPDTRIFIFLLNETRQVPDAKGETVIARNRQVNEWTREAAAGAAQVTLLRMADFAVRPDEMGKFNQFDRMVHVRAFQHVLGALVSAREEAAS